MRLYRKRGVECPSSLGLVGMSTYPNMHNDVVVVEQRSSVAQGMTDRLNNLIGLNGKMAILHSMLYHMMVDRLRASSFVSCILRRTYISVRG